MGEFHFLLKVPESLTIMQVLRAGQSPEHISPSISTSFLNSESYRLWKEMVVFFNDYKWILLTWYQEEIRMGERNRNKDGWKEYIFSFGDGDFKVYFFTLIKNPDTQYFIPTQVSRPCPSLLVIQHSNTQCPLFPLEHTDTNIYRNQVKNRNEEGRWNSAVQGRNEDCGQ